MVAAEATGVAAFEFDAVEFELTFATFELAAGGWQAAPASESSRIPPRVAEIFSARIEILLL
jgi:hypothetical protein